MTGTTCKSIAEIRESAECNSDAVKGVRVLPEVAIKNTKQRNEPHPEVLQPPGRGEEWLVPPTEWAGEEAQPATSAPSLYPLSPPPEPGTFALNSP